MKGTSFGRKLFETLKHMVTGRLDTLNRNIATSDPNCHVAKVISGHEMSVVFSSFSAITFDRD